MQYISVIILDDVYADVSGKAEKENRTDASGNEETYLVVRDVAVELNVKNVHMAVKKVFNNNRILSKYSYIFVIWLNFNNFLAIFKLIFCSRGNKPFLAWKRPRSPQAHAASAETKAFCALHGHRQQITQACPYPRFLELRFVLNELDFLWPSVMTCHIFLFA